jgi:uncharacterized protein
MTVYGVSFDLGSKQPIVLLRTLEGSVFLPIWIGQPEAVAILMKLQGSEPPRPLTHDLTCSIIESLDAELTRVTVTELRENTFHAAITLLRNGDEIEIDSRTSDAIALALRAEARIYAADEVIEESGVEFEGGDPELDNGVTPPPTLGDVSIEDVDLGEFRRFLDTVSPDEFRAAETEDDN